MPDPEVVSHLKDAARPQVALSAIIDKTREDALTLHRRTNGNVLKAMSVNLLIQAYCFHENEYYGAQGSMLYLLKINPHTMNRDFGQLTIAPQFTANEAWMLGRMLIGSSIFIQGPAPLDNTRTREDVIINQLATHMENYVNDRNIEGYSAADLSQACEHAWAMAYYLIYCAERAPNTYTQNMPKHLEKCNQLVATLKQAEPENLSSIVWIHVMNLHAAAVKKDTALYTAIKTQFKTDVADKYLGQLIKEHLPQDHLRFWAYSLTMHSAMLMDDTAEMWNGFTNDEVSRLTSAHFSDDPNADFTLGSAIQMHAYGMIKEKVEVGRSPAGKLANATGGYCNVM